MRKRGGRGEDARSGSVGWNTDNAGQRNLPCRDDVTQQFQGILVIVQRHVVAYSNAGENQPQISGNSFARRFDPCQQVTAPRCIGNADDSSTKFQFKDINLQKVFQSGR